MIGFSGVRKGRSKRTRIFLSLGVLLGLTLQISACGSGGDTPGGQLPPDQGGQPVSSGADAPSDEPSSDVEPALSSDEITALWQDGAHAVTFVLDADDENSMCARCHAPVNWLPSMDDIPESCLACKFELSQLNHHL